MIFLFADWVFREGYRRFEWKCDALNLPSRRAAERFGFSFEGVFRQATVVKGRNRDTAWFAMTDGDWRCLKPAWEAWLDPANFDADGRQRQALGRADRALPRRLGPGAVSRRGASVRRWQRRWKDGWIGDLDAPGARRNATIDMLLFDHGLLRKAWRNSARDRRRRLALEPAGPGDDPAAGKPGVPRDPEPARRDAEGLVPARARGLPGGRDRARRLQALLAQAADAARRSWRSTRSSRGCRGRS